MRKDATLCTLIGMFECWRKNTAGRREAAGLRGKNTD